jgi:hypothetical protein
MKEKKTDAVRTPVDTRILLDYCGRPFSALCRARHVEWLLPSLEEMQRSRSTHV